MAYDDLKSCVPGSEQTHLIGLQQQQLGYGSSKAQHANHAKMTDMNRSCHRTALPRVVQTAVKSSKEHVQLYILCRDETVGI